MDRILTTQRLTLRPLSPTDAEVTAHLMTPGIARWTGSWIGEETPERVHERIARYLSAEQAALSSHRAAVITATGALIGWIGVRRSETEPRRGSIGYWIGEAYFGQGYTREAARAILDAAWSELDLDVIEGGAQLANAASIAVLKGLGMRSVGEREEYATARDSSDLCAFYEIERP